VNEYAPLADNQIEQVVLGAMMESPRAAEQVAELLRPTDFYTPAHQILFTAIRSQLAAGEPADPKAIAYRLNADGDLSRIGGGPYLHTLMSAVPVAAQAPWYAERVSDYATRRAIVAAATKAIQAARNTGTDLPDVVEHVQSIVHGATTRRDDATVLFTEILDDTLAEVFHPEGPARGLSTGLGSLDDVIGGLKPGQLIVVAGRPGAGKSVLVTDFVRACAVRQYEPALMFSLEMGRGEVQRRMLAAEAGVNLSRILNGPLQPHETMKLADRADALRGVMIHIDDTASMDLASIRSTARKIQADTGLGLIVVDYLQLMGSTSGDNRAQEVGAISRGLKILARELGVPIVAAAQLNRSAEQRSDHRPQLADLRESGSIEQDSDIVILLHRPDYHDSEHMRAGEIDLIVAKNRNGPIETVTAAAQLHYSRIVDIGIQEPS
jgi:replicative DNA helicase